MDLFDYMREQNKETSGPLASRMRPTTLDEVVGAAAHSWEGQAFVSCD